MSISISPLAFSDCYEAMDAALDDERGVRLPVDNKDAATYFRMRVHQARKLARERNTQIYKPGDPLYGVSEYDRLVCRIRLHKEQLYVYLEQVPNISDKLEPLSELEDEMEKVGIPVITVVDEPNEPPQPSIIQLRRRI